jgi:hypothetical protein
MSDLEKEARKFKEDTEAKFAKQYEATKDLIERVSKLERKMDEILGKKS